MISVGVPTVIDAATLVCDLVENADYIMDENLHRSIVEEGADMMITPKEVDLTVERASKLVALAINCALQPQIPAEDLLALVS